MKKYITLAAFLASTWNAQAQWELFGNSGLTQGVDFLGTTDGSFLDVRTEDIRRMTLLPDAAYSIGLIPSQAKNGSLLLSPDVDQFYTNGAPGPYSLLHLAAADDNAQQASYRDWMDLGVTLTGNADHSYMGLTPGGSPEERGDPAAS